MLISDCMTRHPVLAPSSMTATEAQRVMAENGIRHLPVVEGGRLMGVVSIGDLVKWRIAEAHAEVEAVRSYIQP